jgi:hypothetical protein
MFNIKVKVSTFSGADIMKASTNVAMRIDSEPQLARALPVVISDSSGLLGRKELQGAFEALKKESVANGNDKMTMDEIDDMISECRRKKDFF